ncbi:MAG: hypothetical protein IKZ45_00225 [Fibrobacter sp.]|nr:hypothetical protein [Fibrobacter sp.]
MKPFVLLLLVAVLLVSCARKEPEVDFKPIQLGWSALSEAAESHPQKDACVIAITSFLMRDKHVSASKMESLDYVVKYDVKGESLEFQGICENPGCKDSVECRWTAVCSGAENVVVKFHNGD